MKLIWLMVKYKGIQTTIDMTLLPTYCYHRDYTYTPCHIGTHCQSQETGNKRMKGDASLRSFVIVGRMISRPHHTLVQANQALLNTEISL